MELLSDGQLELDSNNLLQVKDEEVSNRLEKPERTLDPYEQYFAQCEEQDDPQLVSGSLGIISSLPSIFFNLLKPTLETLGNYIAN